MCLFAFYWTKTTDNGRPIPFDKLDLIAQRKNVLARTKDQVPNDRRIVPLVRITIKIRDFNEPFAPVRAYTDPDTRTGVLD